MPTKKKRINVTVSDEMDSVLEFLAKRDNVPTATKACELIKIAVELEEEDVLIEIAESRDNKESKFVSHEEAWS